MTNEERDLIAAFIARTGGPPAPAAAGAGFGAAGVPATVPPPGAAPLPPIDPEADRFIAAQFQQHPEARYRITQMAFVQEHALAEAQNRINRLESELNQARQQVSQMAQQTSRPAPPAGSVPASPWGAAAPAPAPAPFAGHAAPWPSAPTQAPQYAPGYRPGLFGGGGSGFLGSALTTAAGVAGGMVAGHALMSLFSGGGSGGGLARTASDPAVASTPGDTGWTDAASAPASPWGANPSGGDAGGWQDAPAPDQGWSDPVSDPGWGGDTADDGGWQDDGGDWGGDEQV